MSRTGRYRLFPIAGSAVTAVGLFLLSRMDQHTSVLGRDRCPCWCSGAGIGLIMQILTLVVQNTVAYSDLGTATSGVTFFRTLGGSFGASIMGSIYSNGLKGRLAAALVAARCRPPAASSPGAGAQAPGRPAGTGRRRLRRSRSSTCSCSRCRIAVAGFVLALFLPQVTMRGLAKAEGVGDGFAVPEGSDNEHQLANMVGQILRRDNRSSLAGILARVRLGAGHSHRLGRDRRVRAAAGVRRSRPGIRRRDPGRRARRGCCGRSSARSSRRAT